MKSIDLNCDMGESFGRYTLGLDEEVIKAITSANVACGWHAGDPLVMDSTVAMARENGVGVGAHPGYPDLLGFGRRNMDCTLEEIRAYVTYQIGALQAFCTAQGMKLQHVKPHGNLYLSMLEDEDLARAVAEAVARVDPQLICLTLAGAKNRNMTRACEALGLKVAYEAFPDRAYTVDGTLVSRRKPGAVIHDPAQATERALRMARDNEVIAEDGTRIPLEVHTLCVHGDTVTAVDLVKQISQGLTSEGLGVKPLGEIM
mgnify:CR=1 FL=1